MSRKELISWATFKKKYAPEIWGVRDSSFGTISTIEPTLRHHGFLVSPFEEYMPYGPDKRLPKQVALDFLGDMDYSLAVFYAYKARDYSSNFVLIAWRKESFEVNEVQMAINRMNRMKRRKQ